MRRLAATLALCAALAACSAGSSPKADLQTKLNAVIDAANAKDAPGLRTAVGEFLQEVQQQSANGDITSTKAQDLRTVADRVLADASLLESQSPAPAPSSARPSPTFVPSPTYSPPPPPTPTPQPTQPPPSPVVVPPVVGSPTPAPSPT